MSNYRFELDRSSKKFTCPECGKKRFVRFIDLRTHEYLPEQYGRCDRGDGHYFLNPYSDGYANSILQDERPIELTNRNTVASKPKPIDHHFEKVYFDIEVFERTLTKENYASNVFLNNLRYAVPFPFTHEDVSRVVSQYLLGTISKGGRKGATTFPFIDRKGFIHAIQVKQFDQSNHTISTDFLHSILERHLRKHKKPFPSWLKNYINQDGRVTCLFGEHLLALYPDNPVALVEAPKTAIYGTLYMGFPEESKKNLLWLAVYNKSSFNIKKIQALSGRTVIVVPDLSSTGETFNEWANKARSFKKNLPGTEFLFYDVLEKIANLESRKAGYDLADFLCKYDWRLFRKPHNTNTNKESINTITPEYEYLMGLYFQGDMLMSKFGNPALWDTTPNYPHIDAQTKKLVELIAEDPELLEILKEEFQRKAR